MGTTTETHYFEIHVSFNTGRDSDGYSVFVAINCDDENDALQYAIANNLFTDEGDEEFVDYIDEIDEDEYDDAKCA